MPIRGRGSKMRGITLNPTSKSPREGGKLTRPTIQTPEIRVFTGELINEKTLKKDVFFKQSIYDVINYKTIDYAHI